MSHPSLPANSGEYNSEEIEVPPSERPGELELWDGSQSLGNMSKNYLTRERCVSKVLKF